MVQLDAALPFGGVVDGVEEQRGRYLVSTLVRGSLCVRVHGLSPETKRNSTIYAVRTARSKRFSVDGPGTVVGELLHIESLERGTAIVGVRLASDLRPFDIDGNHRRGGLVQSKDLSHE